VAVIAAIFKQVLQIIDDNFYVFNLIVFVSTQVYPLLKRVNGFVFDTYLLKLLRRLSNTCFIISHQ